MPHAVPGSGSAGVMTAALMSRPMAVLRALRHSHRPAVVDVDIPEARRRCDTVTTTVRLVEEIDARRRIRFEVESRNQHGEPVMVGEAVEKVL